MVESHFDKIYVLNLKKREERLNLTRKRLSFAEIENYTVFNGVDGSVMEKVWKVFSTQNSYFANSSYLGCAISHLSIYRHALDNGYEKILILEDDNRVHRLANSLMNHFSSQIPDWKDLLYLGFIPLSDDRSHWDYNVINKFVSQNVFVARNLWGLYAYGISSSLMKEMLEVYSTDFPMEIDRYFVEHIQPKGTSYGIVPQIFAADDGFSDNSRTFESSLLERSVDTRFAKLTDYL